MAEKWLTQPKAKLSKPLKKDEAFPAAASQLELEAGRFKLNSSGPLSWEVCFTVFVCFDVCV